MLHKPPIRQYAASAAWILVLGAAAFAFASMYGHERGGGLYMAALGFTIGLLCVLPVVYLMSAARSRSLHALVAGLELAREGTFQELDEASVPPEFVPVTHSYNRMGQTLEARQHELHAQLRNTALLTRLSLELRGSLDPHAIVRDVLLVLASNTEADTASILLLAPSGTVEIATAITSSQLSEIPLERANKICERGLAGWALRNDHRVVLPDISKDERWLRFEDQEARGSAIVLPLIYGRTTLGVLTITHHAREHFTSKDLLLMEGVAAQASAALSAAQRHAEDVQRREQALVLLSMSQFLTSKRSGADLANELLQKSASVFEIYHSALYLQDREAGQLSCIAALPGQLAPNLAPNAAFEEAMAAAAERAWQSQETIIDTLAAAAAGNADELACVALPLLHNGDTIGAFVLLSPARG
ncbi:MAG TPA: GAF domain-containing protein, partial [Roseiflexaceae bacterium]|nr:GAF domain-containing protein [Roseiflexaceae bacterium]